MIGSRIILPGSSEYQLTLATLPPDWKQVANQHGTFALIGDESGLLRAVGGQEAREYMLGGEFFEHLEQTGFLTDEESDSLLDINYDGVEEFYIDM
jgi:hypothetical protein